MCILLMNFRRRSSRLQGASSYLHWHFRTSCSPSWSLHLGWVHKRSQCLYAAFDDNVSMMHLCACISYQDCICFGENCLLTYHLHRNRFLAVHMADCSRRICLCYFSVVRICTCSNFLQHPSQSRCSGRCPHCMGTNHFGHDPFKAPQPDTDLGASSGSMRGFRGRGVSSCCPCTRPSCIRTSSGWR